MKLVRCLKLWKKPRGNKLYTTYIFEGYLKTSLCDLETFVGFCFINQTKTKKCFEVYIPRKYTLYTTKASVTFCTVIYTYCNVHCTVLRKSCFMFWLNFFKLPLEQFKPKTLGSKLWSVYCATSLWISCFCLQYTAVLLCSNFYLELHLAKCT